MANKTKEELIKEIKLLQKRIAKLETADTERRKSEIITRNKHLELDTILDSSPMMIFYKDKENNFIRVNEALAKSAGLTKEDMEGKSLFDLYSKETAEQYWQDDKAVMYSGQSQLNRIEPMKTKEGDRWVQTDKIPYKNEKGEIIGIIGFTIDITEHKRIGDALNKSYERLNFTLQGAGLGSWDWNPQTGEVIYSNIWAEILEYRLDEVEPSVDFFKRQIHPEDLQAVLERLTGHIEGRIPVYESEHRLRTKSGRWLWVLDRGKVIESDKDGRPVRVTGIIADITARKHAVNSLIQSEKLASLGRLVSEIAHEINNPLMIISGHTQIILSSETISAEAKSILKIIMDQCQRAANIMHRVLKFSQPDKGETKEVEISQSIESVAGIIEKQFKMANVEIKRNYPKKPILVSIDNQLMQEVFMNLLSNAKDAMPDGGTITITVSLEGNFYRIDFKDTGCGISEEDKKKMYEPFFTTKEKGTGLGLAICYGTVKAHNGELVFESQLNKGTTATVLLPLGGAKEHSA